MIKKIQNYLLENHPLLWNTRFFPIMLIILLANVLFFVFGYWSTHTVFDDGYRYSYLDGDGIVLLYFASIFIGILIFVGWLIFYMRNNAFRIYYPRSTVQLYMEWLIGFVICVGITFIPLSMTNGCRTKWQGVTSERQAQEALETLLKVRVLIPTDQYDYSYQSDVDEPIPIPKNMPLNLDSINLDNYSMQYDSDGQFVVNGYNGPSLLFCKGDHYYFYYYDSEDSDEKQQQNMEQVKSWLMNEQKDSIYALMKDYMALIRKHDLECDLNADTWFDRIYNPPFFPVESSILISKDSPSEYSYSSYYDDDDYYRPKISYSSLERGYKNILDSHRDTDELRYITLICLCFALGFSMLVFSCRVTSGKKWLKSFVIAGILILLISLFGGVLSFISFMSDGDAYFLLIFFFWIFLFAGVVAYLISKVVRFSNKHHSHVTMNFFLWLMPCMIPLCFFMYFIYLELVVYDYDSYSYYDRPRIENYVEGMFWLNLVMMIIAMIPACVLIKKWKGLSDE